MTYVIDPTQPLPARWKDDYGPIRLMTTSPVEGYVMARRPGSYPFVQSLERVLAEWAPILPKPKTSVRAVVAKIKADQEAKLRKMAHGGKA